MLLGGDDKGTDLAPLVEAARAHARAAVCFGAARERFAAAFGVDGSAGEDGGDFAVLQASCLEDALDAALAIAGLAAQVETIVERARLIDRGYESLETALTHLGADVQRISVERGEEHP